MAALVQDKVWVDKKNYDDAEKTYYENLAKPETPAEQATSPKNKRKNKKDKKNRNTNSISDKDSEKNDSLIADVEASSPKASEESTKPTAESPKPAVESSKPAVESPKPAVESPKPAVEAPKEKQGKNRGKKNKNQPKEEVKDQVKVDLKEQAKAEELQILPQQPTSQTKEVKTFANVTKTVNKPKETNESKTVENKTEAGVLQTSSLASEVAKARQHIKNSLECMESVAALAGIPNPELLNKISSLENENTTLKKTINDLRHLVIDIQKRVESLEKKPAGTPTAQAASTPKAPAPKEDSDDGVDLFASDDEEESAEAAKIREERLAAYNAKKSKKPAIIAKSNIILDVKPWDDETDMKAMEEAVRGIKMDGLLWGACKLVPLAYGIHKLQISCVVEDDKVSIDELTEELEKLEDFVQSVDIAAFNKV